MTQCFVCLYCRVQEFLQEERTPEFELLVPGQPQLPGGPAPPEPVPVLPSEEVPQDGHEARRWVPIHRSIHPQHHALFTPLPPLPPNTSTSYFHSLEPSFCYYYYFYYYYCYSAGSSGRWVMVLSDSV